MKRNPEVAILSLLSDVTGYGSYKVSELCMHARLSDGAVRRTLLDLESREIVRRSRPDEADLWTMTAKGRRYAKRKYGRRPDKI